MSVESLPEDVQKNVRIWLEKDFDLDTKNALKALLNSSPKQVIDAFYQPLSFGTGGLRALSGIGISRINYYTISFASQAVANSIKKHFPKQKLLVIIVFDSREDSEELAKAAAQVFQKNGIHVYLGKRPLPTPFLSFCLRKLNAHAGIVITASHNPPEYNGFKVYWKDGGQILSPYAEEILEEFSKITSPEDLKKEKTKAKCLPISKKWEEEYINYCYSLSPNKKLCIDKGSLIKIIYTNLHGTGIELIPRLFLKMGFTDFSLVEKQKELDGKFPFAKNPNPEEEEALQLGIEQLVKENGDLLLATDPDADRISCVIRGQEGTPTRLTGNQVACLLLNYLLHQKQEDSSLSQLVAIKTLVTTELFRAICDYYKIECLDVPTGFKYIAKEMENLEQTQKNVVVFGAEESCGYLTGNRVRDKDACLAAQLISECSLAAKVEGKTLIDCLEDLYTLHGFFFETQRSLTFEETQDGKQKLGLTLEKLQTPSLVHQLFPKVLSFSDYQKKIVYSFETGEEIVTNFPLTHMYKLSFDDLNLFVRPSGTEPKIKFYFNFVKQGFEDREKQTAICQLRVDELMKSLR